nr:hypothetical protein CFP56_11708 [Quercus suber]
MVLDNASADPPSDDPYADTSFTPEAPFENSIDSYASSAMDSTRIPVGPGVFVNPSNLPQPVPVLSLGNPYASVLLESIRGNVKVVSKTLQRPTRQEEVDAIAFHTAKGMRLASYGNPIGAVLGVAVATRGHATYRFPFYSPMKEGGWFNPDKFPLLAGRQARIAWQLTRYGLYSILGSVMGGIFFGSYGLTVSMQGRVTDPRLKEFMDALRKAQKEGKNIKDFMGQGDAAPGARPRDNETFEMARQRAGVQEVWKQKQPKTQSTPQREIDDASPTGGMFSDEYTTASAKRYEEPKPSVQQPPQIGDAWAKLRRDASINRHENPKSPRTRSSSDENDSPSFLSDTRDYHAARSEEQKQFDAQLQREREGKDFDGSGGGG